jgi:predicted dehydrogenase
MVKKVGIGLIGCGGRLRYVLKRLLEQSPRLEVRGISDPSKSSIETVKAMLDSDVAVYKNYKDLLKADNIDWVMIGSWNCFHRDHAVAAFQAGKDVFCEKPLATNLKDCLAMYKAWKKSGKQFNIGFTLRYSPHYRKIKELLSKNLIGDIISLEFNETLGFNHGGYIMGDWRREIKNAGTHLLEKCSHDVDLVNWMVGSTAKSVASFGGLDFFLPKNEKHIKRLGKDKNGKWAYRTWPGKTNKNPFTAKKDIIDNQVAIIEYANGVRASFHTNCNAGIPERRMYICGTEGAIRSDIIKGQLQLQQIGFNTKLKDIKTGVAGGHGGGDAVLAKELALSMLKGVRPATGLEDGLKSAVTCFAIDKAMDSQKVVNVAPFWKQVGIKS